MSPLERLLVFFLDENKALVKGENAVESNHVVGVTQDPESGTLQGDIQASQRDKTYAVKVFFCFMFHRTLRMIFIYTISPFVCVSILNFLYKFFACKL